MGPVLDTRLLHIRHSISTVTLPASSVRNQIIINCCECFKIETKDNIAVCTVLVNGCKFEH
jgi:hypothetical protein